MAFRKSFRSRSSFRRHRGGVRRPAAPRCEVANFHFQQVFAAVPGGGKLSAAVQLVGMAQLTAALRQPARSFNVKGIVYDAIWSTVQPVAAVFAYAEVWDVVYTDRLDALLNPVKLYDWDGVTLGSGGAGTEEGTLPERVHFRRMNLLADGQLNFEPFQTGQMSSSGTRRIKVRTAIDDFHALFVGGTVFNHTAVAHNYVLTAGGAIYYDLKF